MDVLCGYRQDLTDDWPQTLASLWRSLKAFPFPARSNWHRALGLLTDRPDLWQAHSSQDLIDEGRRLTQNELRYDRIHVAGFEMYGCAKAIRDGMEVPVPLVLDEHNIEFRLQQSLGECREDFPTSLQYRAFNALQTRKLQTREEEAWRESSYVLTVSEEDRQDALRIIQSEKVLLLPNGIDVQESGISPFQEPRPYQLSFIGKMDYRPNVLAVQWFCFNVLPTLLRLQPKLRLCIVGRDPAAEILELKKLRGVTVTGFVENLRPYYAPGTIAVMPIFHGGGTRLKVLEAIMAGIPIVSTGLGVSGFGLEDGRHYLLADDAEAFVEAISSIWNGKMNSEQVIRESREFIEKRFDWSVHLPLLDRIYQ